MNEEELKILQIKADKLEQILKKYRTLQADAGFYSKNWVELSEVIETAVQELAKIQ
ncbi:MAG: hypothetical protein V3R94_03215 [Acidobacteriota bacterium]